MVVLYATLIFACVWFGVTFAKKLHSRYMIYYDLYQFLKLYEENLSFRQDNLKDLVNRFIKDTYSDFSKILEQTLIQNQKEIRHDFLTEKELNFIVDMLNSLGHTDKDTEMQQIKHFQFMINNEIKKAKETKDKYSTLSIKISFLIGLLLVVLLL